MHTHRDTLTHTHTHRNTHSQRHSHTETHTHTLAHTLTHRDTHSQRHSHTETHTHTLSHTLSHTNTHTQTYTHTLSHHTHTLITHTHSHSLITHTHTQTHTLCFCAQESPLYLFGLHLLREFLEAFPESDEHPRVIRPETHTNTHQLKRRSSGRETQETSSPQLMGFSVVVQRVEGHLEDLVRLSESVPGPVVPFVHFNCMPKRPEQNNITFIYFNAFIHYLIHIKSGI